MPRYLRYLLIWLSCTAVSATAVVLTVHFVVGSTRPKPPVAQSVPTLFPSPTPARTTVEPSPEPSRKPSPTSASPKASPSRAIGRTRVPRPRFPSPGRGVRERPQEAERSALTCDDSTAGVHTIQSQGGQVSARFGSTGVCLVSAVPTRGFTVRTQQTEPTTLTVTFSGQRHRSEITATTTPRYEAKVRETSW